MCKILAVFENVFDIYEVYQKIINICTSRPSMETVVVHLTLFSVNVLYDARFVLSIHLLFNYVLSASFVKHNTVRIIVRNNH